MAKPAVPLRHSVDELPLAEPSLAAGLGAVPA